MADSKRAPATVEELRSEILARYEGFSKRLQQIARHVLDEPNAIALETLAVIAARSGVQPSAIVRFAKSLGFDGASQMQKLLRDGLLSANTPLGYNERARQFGEAVATQAVGGPGQLLAEFAEGSALALQTLRQGIDEASLEQAVRAISEAGTVYIAGFRRSFPVAAYLSYSLLQADKRTVFVDGVAGLAARQVQSMAKGDLLIAISFQPYAEEVVALVEQAAARGHRILSISDSLVSPIAKSASIVLQVRDAEVRKFRSLTASMCLAQVLVVAYAFAAAR